MAGRRRKVGYRKGVARRGGAVLPTGRCQLEKTGRRSSERPTQEGLISPADCSHCTSGLQVSACRQT
ncbi:hypothetical protein PFLUV_G00117670 [Perca fluviatilis]|uniref:Uncharacterized protein n=1 Tax=Perca fluviatilis TaxID=8168 RepID=A0A6A5F6I3_PERFL|nr:hypothetical protein PFLUV_G00117670 [Perca fluviatilis]